MGDLILSNGGKNFWSTILLHVNGGNVLFEMMKDILYDL